MTMQNTKETLKKENYLLKKTLITIGVIVVTCIVIGTIIFISFKEKGDEFDRSSKLFVDKEVPLVIKNWDIQELQSKADPAYKNLFNSKDLHSLFSFLSKNAGQMKKYEGSEGEAGIWINNFKVYVTAQYAARVAFDKTHGTVNIALSRYHDQWHIVGFHVNLESGSLDNLPR